MADDDAKADVYLLQPRPAQQQQKHSIAKRLLDQALALRTELRQQQQQQQHQQKFGKIEHSIGALMADNALAALDGHALQLRPFSEADLAAAFQLKPRAAKRDLTEDQLAERKAQKRALKDSMTDEQRRLHKEAKKKKKAERMQLMEQQQMLQRQMQQQHAQNHP